MAHVQICAKKCRVSSDSSIWLSVFICLLVHLYVLFCFVFVFVNLVLCNGGYRIFSFFFVQLHVMELSFVRHNWVTSYSRWHTKDGMIWVLSVVVNFFVLLG